jgi:hypothetical protein
MSDNNKFSLGGFPPIYEITGTLQKKEYQSKTIMSIESILNTNRGLNIVMARPPEKEKRNTKNQKKSNSK